MRRPKTPGSPDEPTPPGGRALGRSQQFALSRGLPVPAAEPAPAPAKPPKKPAKTAAKKLAKTPAARPKRSG